MKKIAFIKKINENTWKVFSQKGKNMGTFHSLKEAKKRLKDIEFFKRKNKFLKNKKARENFYNFILFAKNNKEKNKEENTYSSYLRKINKNSPDKIKNVMSKFKKIFDEALLKETPTEELEPVCLLELQSGDKDE